MDLKNLALIALLLSSGCIRDVPPQTTSTLPMPLPDLTTLPEPVITTSTLDYKQMYEDMLASTGTDTHTVTMVFPTETTTTSSTTTTSTSTTSTIKHRTIQTNILPSRFNISANWTSCTKNRDCVMLPDCCGWDFGFKYAINEWSISEYDRYKRDFCQSKDHRKGCGWSTPKTTQTKCVNSKCELSYGGFVPDELQDDNFTYTFDWMSRLDDVNYTVMDSVSVVPGEPYDPYGLYTPSDPNKRGDMQ